MIYHVLKLEEWEQARKQNVFTPATFEQDGFIHLCEADQFEGVVNRYFLGQGDLVALCVAPEALVATLLYENLVGGQVLFPHLYGPLNLDAVRDVIYFRSAHNQSNGSFLFDDIKSPLKD